MPAISLVENTNQTDCCETSVGYRTVGLLRKQWLTARDRKGGARLAPSGHHRRRVGAEPRIPLAERGLPFPIQHPGADLQQQISTPLTPPHLLLFHHPLAHYVVHRGFHKARTDPLAVAVALAVVRDETAIALDVGGKLLYGFAEFLRRGVVALPDGRLQIAFHQPQLLQCSEDVAMPEKPLDAFQFPHHVASQRECFF